VDALLFHYTDKKGYNAIRSQPEWCFKASQPPADHPIGAYFTTLAPRTPSLAVRLRIPRRKIDYVFCFQDIGDLTPLAGDRGEYVLYNADDYTVPSDRQVYHGRSDEAPEVSAS